MSIKGRDGSETNTDRALNSRRPDRTALTICARSCVGFAGRGTVKKATVGSSAATPGFEPSGRTHGSRSPSFCSGNPLSRCLWSYLHLLRLPIRWSQLALPLFDAWLAARLRCRAPRAPVSSELQSLLRLPSLCPLRVPAVAHRLERSPRQYPMRCRALPLPTTRSMSTLRKVF